MTQKAQCVLGGSDRLRGKQLELRLPNAPDPAQWVRQARVALYVRSVSTSRSIVLSSVETRDVGIHPNLGYNLKF